jgi:hypothetical protein
MIDGSTKRQLFPAASLGILTTVFVLLIGAMNNFNVGLNDFWGLLYYADQLTLAEPMSLYNGFFPIGYALILKLLPEGWETVGAYSLSALFAGLLVAVSGRIAGASHGFWAMLGACTLVLMAPIVFQYANVPGPDIGTAALTALAVWFL